VQEEEGGAQWWVWNEAMVLTAAAPDARAATIATITMQLWMVVESGQILHLVLASVGGSVGARLPSAQLSVVSGGLDDGHRSMEQAELSRADREQKGERDGRENVGIWVTD
jgi:hypothetical protein